MTNIIILIRHTRLPPPDIPPPSLAPAAIIVVLAPVQRQRRREQDLEAVPDGAGEELRVDVEREGCVAVFGVRGEAGDAVVFGGVDGGEGEGGGEEVGVAHGWRVGG